MWVQALLGSSFNLFMVCLVEELQGIVSTWISSTHRSDQIQSSTSAKVWILRPLWMVAECVSVDNRWFSFWFNYCELIYKRLIIGEIVQEISSRNIAKQVCNEPFSQLKAINAEKPKCRNSGISRTCEQANAHWLVRFAKLVIEIIGTGKSTVFGITISWASRG